MSTEKDDFLRHRYPLTKSIPSLTTESTCSFLSESDEDVVIEQQDRTTKSKQLERRQSSISVVVNSTFLKKRLSRQSSLPWGHRRSTMVGVSCFLFLLPTPLLVQSCCPWAAFMLAVVTATSFSSDYVYTGIESWSHLLDRAAAPIALVSFCISYIYEGSCMLILLARYYIGILYTTGC